MFNQKIPVQNQKNIHNQQISPEDIRILRRDLMYLTNIPEVLANAETLASFSFIGQYGRITKILVNKENNRNKKTHTFSAYIYFEREFDCAIAILSLNGFRINNQILNASFGMTRYCCFFLKSRICGKKNCSYVHYIADREDCTNNKIREFNKKIRKFKKDKIIDFIIRKNFNLENLKNSIHFLEDNFSFCFPMKANSYKKIIKYLNALKITKENEKKENMNKMMEKNYGLESFSFKKEENIFYTCNLSHKILLKQENSRTSTTKPIKVQNYNFFKEKKIHTCDSESSMNTKLTVSNENELTKKNSFSKYGKEKLVKNSNSIDRLVGGYLKRKQKKLNFKSRFSFVENSNSEKKPNTEFWTDVFNIFETDQHIKSLVKKN